MDSGVGAMEEYLAGLCALVALGTLLSSGARHLSSLARLVDAIRAHGVLPSRGAESVAMGLGLLEVVTAVAGLVTATPVFSRPELARISLVVAGALFGAFCLYSWVALRRAPDAPCGCSRDEHPSTIWVPIRGGSLAIIALAAVALIEEPILGQASDVHSLLTLVGAVAVGMLLWSLPAAMVIPRQEELA